MYEWEFNKLSIFQFFLPFVWCLSCSSLLPSWHFFSPGRFVAIQTVSEPRSVWRRRKYTRDEVREQINAARRDAMGRGLQVFPKKQSNVEKKGESRDCLTTCFCKPRLVPFFWKAFENLKFDHQKPPTLGQVHAVFVASPMAVLLVMALHSPRDSMTFMAPCWGI